jgi:hypothetical protein
VKVSAVTVMGARVHVALEDMRAVNQLALSFHLGLKTEGEVLFTVNEVPMSEVGR